MAAQLFQVQREVFMAHVFPRVACDWLAVSQKYRALALDVIWCDPRSEPTHPREHLRNKKNMTLLPLEWACMEGHMNVIGLLLQHKDVDPAQRGQYCLDLACHYGRTDVVQRLLNDPRIDVNHNAKNAFCIACRCGHADILRHFLSHPHLNLLNHPRVILYSVGRYGGHPNIVRALLEDKRWTKNAGQYATIIKECLYYWGNGVTLSMLLTMQPTFAPTLELTPLMKTLRDRLPALLSKQNAGSRYPIKL
jgi:hypothetical protein